MISPVSAGSGPKSPWPTVRKGSIPGPRRPPSPELTNLDCAFPPFPLPTKAPTTKKRDRSATQRSETKGSGTRDAHQTGRRPPLTREGSSNTSGTKTGDTLQTSKSRPASPLSNELKLDGHHESAEPLSEVRPPLPRSPLAIETQAPPPSLPDTAPSFAEPVWDEQSQDSEERELNLDLTAFDFGDAVLNQSVPRSLQPGLNDRVRAETDPTYKSKRPPPILGHQDIMPLVKSTTAPQPSPTGSLGRSIGRLFGRRPSQSATRRDVARQALSDEPDSFEKTFAGQSILSPGSDRSFFTAEPSPVATSPLIPSETLVGYEQSLKALEGLTSDVGAVAPAVVVFEPGAEPGKKLDELIPADIYTTEAPEPSEASEQTPDPDGAELIEALRRVSIDSASSYGSIGLTERTTSSRSTAPQVDSTPTESMTPLGLGLPELTYVDMPAPLRPKISEVPPESPLDPIFQQERLSPKPESAHQPQDSLDSLPSIHMELDPSSEPSQEPQSSPRNVTNPLAPNKGVCRGCSQLILAGQKSVSSADGRLTGRYHKKCFVCKACKTSFPTAEFYVHNDHPYCAHHYHELENSLCATCGKGIEGLYMETSNVAGRGKESLKCATCKMRLDHDYFELSGKVYCERDAFRQATLPRSHDNAPSRPSPLVREYISSGDPGLVKGRNFPERRTTKLMNLNMI
jgi:hypothetical protein